MPYLKKKNISTQYGRQLKILKLREGHLFCCPKAPLVKGEEHNRSKFRFPTAAIQLQLRLKLSSRVLTEAALILTKHSYFIQTLHKELRENFSLQNSHCVGYLCSFQL